MSPLPSTFISAYIYKSILVLSMLCAYTSFGQQKKAADSILILGNEYAEFIKKDEHTVHKLMHDVKLLHGSDTLYCDSAFFYTHINSVEAFGDVVIRQADGTEAFADYMRYTGNDKIVFMRAYNGREVQLVDSAGNSLWSKEIAYNLRTKIGTYRNGGQLQNETTVLISDRAVYNLHTKEARFTGNVTVVDPEYNAVSTDLGYNTESKMVRFFGPSVVVNEESVLRTTSGTYDSKQKIAHFTERSSLMNQAQYIEADTLHYDRNTGFGEGFGNVISIDTTQKSILFSGYVQYNEQTKVMLSYLNPVMKKLDGKESRYLRADTFYSAPIMKPLGLPMTAQDSLELTADILQSAVEASEAPDALAYQDSLAVEQDSLISDLNMPLDPVVSPNQDTLYVPVDTSISGPTDDENSQLVMPPFDPLSYQDTLRATPDNKLEGLKFQMDQLVYSGKPSDSIAKVAPQPDSSARFPDYQGDIQPNADTAGPRYFVAYHNVVIWSDSLQGKCDSLKYTESDSLMVMYGVPVLWPKSGQMNGEVIIMKMDTQSLREIIIPKDGIMINRSGPEQAGMYDQVQGNMIHGFLSNNELDSLIAEGNAASIYYVTDDDSAYVGGSEATAERIEILFDEQKIDKIYYRNNVEQTMTPMNDVEPDTLHLSRFKWLEMDRPKSLEEFLDGLELPPVPEL